MEIAKTERTFSSYPLPVPSLLAAAAVLRGILESIDGERAKVLLNTNSEEEKRNSECGFSGIDDERRRFNNARVAAPVKTLATAAAAVTATVMVSKAALKAATYARTTACSNGAETAAANAVAGAWRLDIGERPPPSISQAQRGHTVMQEHKHEQGKQHERQHMQKQPGKQKERQQVQYQSHERDQRLDQPSFDEQQHLRQQKDVLDAQYAIPTPASQPALALPHGYPPSRRPGRPFRKREERRSPEDYFCAAPGALNRESLLLLTAAGVDALDAKRMCDDTPGNSAKVADRGERPRNSLQQQRQRKRQKQKTDPAARFATDSAPPPPPSSSAPALFANSVSRVLSSETYLRRLFVTASLAHVLSLDECLPRSMTAKWAVSSRAGGGVFGNGAAAEVVGEDGREKSEWCEGGHVEAASVDGSIDSNNSNADIDIINRPPPPSLSTHDGNVGLFKKFFPVTLVDNAGRRWSMMYETTRRDNLHSGRLVDGWESFCFANGLRVGDQVEFTKVEAPAHQRRGQRGKEVVAMVAAYRKHAKFREFGV